MTYLQCLHNSGYGSRHWCSLHQGIDGFLLGLQQSLIFFLLLLDRVHKEGTRNICTVHAVSGAQAAQDDIILQTAVVAGCADFQVILAATLYYWGIRYVQIGSSQLDLYFLRISQYLLNLFTELAVLDLLFLINDACITAWYVSIWLQRLLYADRDILLTLAEQFRQAVQSYANGIHGIWVVLVSLTHTQTHANGIHGIWVVLVSLTHTQTHTHTHTHTLQSSF